MVDDRRRKSVAVQSTQGLQRGVASRWLIALAITGALSACGWLHPAEPADESAVVEMPEEDPIDDGVARVGRPVMGTAFQVTVRAADAESARKMAEKAVRLGRHWDDVLTTWRDDGELAAFNRGAGEGWQEISPDLAMALDRMHAYSSMTGGSFDPAVGGLVRALRFGKTTESLRRSTIENAIARRPGEALLESGVEIDPGGCGKGLALDRIALALRSLGAEAALLDFGGTSQLAFGDFPDGPPLIPATALREGETHGVVPLDGLALSTARSPNELSVGPIVDPRTGLAIRDRRLAMVAAESATAAEAWSTALVVLGRTGIAAAVDNGVEVLFEDDMGLVVTAGFPLRKSETEDPPTGEEAP